MSGKQGAYGARAGDTDFRKKWDKEEYAEKAKKKDEEEKVKIETGEDTPLPEKTEAPSSASRLGEDAGDEEDGERGRSKGKTKVRWRGRGPLF